MLWHFQVDMRLAEISSVLKMLKLYENVDQWIYSQLLQKYFSGSWLISYWLLSTMRIYMHSRDTTVNRVLEKSIRCRPKCRHSRNGFFHCIRWNTSRLAHYMPIMCPLLFANSSLVIWKNSKFQGIIPGKDVPQPMVLSAQGHDIPPFNNLRLLGVTLENKHNFDMHTDKICLSASRQINALKGLSRFFDEDSRVLIYKSIAICWLRYIVITLDKSI